MSRKNGELEYERSLGYRPRRPGAFIRRSPPSKVPSARTVRLRALGHRIKRATCTSSFPLKCPGHPLPEQRWELPSRTNVRLRSRRACLRTSSWKYSGIAVLVVLQVGSTIATARLIAPEWLGLYAAAQAASGLALNFAFATVGLAVLRRSELAEKTVGSAIVISLASVPLFLTRRRPRSHAYRSRLPSWGECFRAE